MAIIVSQSSFNPTNFIKRYMKWFFPLFLVLLMTPFSSYLDMYFESLFYFDSLPHFRTNAFCYFMFTYSIYAAQIVALSALAVFVLSFFSKNLEKWQKPALALILTMAVGAGLIVHTVFKDRWGRPRPRQVIEFGGMQEYRPYYKPNFFHQPEPSKSFPCGHCTMGFYFFAVALLFKRLGNRNFYVFFFLFSIVLGVALGVARMKMGAHFFSDVVMTGVLMWYTACVFDQLLCSNLSNPRNT